MSGLINESPKAWTKDVTASWHLAFNHEKQPDPRCPLCRKDEPKK